MTDLYAITSIHPSGMSEPPVVEVTPRGAVIKWRADGAQFDVILDGHVAPIAYMRKFAASLNVAANEKEAAS